MFSFQCGLFDGISHVDDGNIMKKQVNDGPIRGGYKINIMWLVSIRIFVRFQRYQEPNHVSKWIALVQIQYIPNHSSILIIKFEIKERKWSPSRLKFNKSTSRSTHWLKRSLNFDPNKMLCTPCQRFYMAVTGAVCVRCTLAQRPDSQMQHEIITLRIAYTPFSPHRKQNRTLNIKNT